MYRLISRTLSVFILLSLSLAAFGQTAQFSGRVTDPSHALVSGADIRVVNQTTGVEKRVRTNAQGAYTVPFVASGTYQVFVQANGFSTAVSEPLTLTVGQAIVFDVQLKVGASSQEVNVDAGSQTINTTDASVSTVIDRKFVANIPLNGRSFQDLISLTPGVATQSPQTTGQTPGYNGDFIINGQRSESNYYTVDGVSGNTRASGGGVSGPGSTGSVAASTALGTTQSLVSVDALQEFRIQSSTYSAEYGRTPGGQLSFVTRSGTNRVHGSAFDYLRNNYFDANDWFNDRAGKPTAALRQNDFGGTFDGPIMVPKLYDGRNKSFFFVSYEGLRLTQPQAATTLYVPDSFMRQEASPALQPILNAFPLPNGIDYGTATSPSLAQFLEPYALPSSIDSTSIRFDYAINDKSTVFFRFGNTTSSGASRVLSVLTNSDSNIRTYTVGTTSQITRSIANEFHLGYADSYGAARGAIDSFGGASPINIATQAGLNSPSTSSLEFVLSIAGAGSSTLNVGNGTNSVGQWNVIDTLSLTEGRHQFKFGVDYARIKSAATPATPYAIAAFVNWNAIHNDAASVLNVYQQLSSEPLFNETSVFAQDEWRVASHVNVSLGIRWELDPPPTGADGRDAYTLQGSLSNPSTLAVAPQGTPLWKTSWYNLAPRLGVAWVAHPSQAWSTTIRTGGGVFFDTDNSIAGIGFSNLGFTALKSYPGSPLPITSGQQAFSPSVTPPYGAGLIYAFPQHMQLPYTLQWNTSLQQGFGTNQSLTISYVGSNGRRQLQERELSLNGVNTNFSTIAYLEGGVSSNYQALQTQFQRSISKGLQALASYTWSHSIDFGSNDAAAPETRGNSDFDVRHSFQGGLSWDLPHAAVKRVLSTLLNQWSLDGRLATRTAFPVTLNGNLLTDPVTGAEYYGNLNLVANAPLYVYGSTYPGGKAINKAAFILPPNNGIGNAPRNIVRGFGLSQVNIAARKEFGLKDGAALQFRAETFNILNHPNFGYVDPTFNDPTFGQATKMLNSSLSTLASQYQQGGPRSMQFALKILF